MGSTNGLEQFRKWLGISETPDTQSVSIKKQKQLGETEKKLTESFDTRQISEHSINTRIDYFFFLVSFLAVIIFSMTPLLSNALPALVYFAKAIVPLVILGVVFGYIGTDIEFPIKMKLSLFGKSIAVERTNNVYISDIIFLTVLLIELSFVWYYVYL